MPVQLPHIKFQGLASLLGVKTISIATDDHHMHFQCWQNESETHKNWLWFENEKKERNDKWVRTITGFGSGLKMKRKKEKGMKERKKKEWHVHKFEQVVWVIMGREDWNLKLGEGRESRGCLGGDGGMSGPALRDSSIRPSYVSLSNCFSPHQPRAPVPEILCWCSSVILACLVLRPIQKHYFPKKLIWLVAGCVGHLRFIFCRT